MARRSTPATLTSVMDDYVHWLGEWQRAIMYMDKLQGELPRSPDTLDRWLQDPSLHEMKEQPVIKRLVSLNKTMLDQADDLLDVAPRSRPPYEAYDQFLRNFEGFISQMRRAERFVNAAEGDLDSRTGLKAGVLIARELADLINRIEQHGEALTVVCAQLDQFSEIVAKYGEAAGDFVIAEVANRASMSLRPFDEVYRLGGAQFLMYLINANLENGVRAIDRVRRKIAILPVTLPNGTEIEVTASFGASQVASTQGVEAVLRNVSDALKTATSNGQNNQVSTK